MFLSIYTLTLFLDSLPMAGAFKGAPRRAATAFPASVAGGLGVHGLGLRGLGFRVYGLGLRVLQLRYVLLSGDPITYVLQVAIQPPSMKFRFYISTLQ